MRAKIFFLFFVLISLSCNNKICNSKILFLVGETSIEALPAGQTTIASAKEVFGNVTYNKDFRRLDNEQPATEKTNVNIYELKRNADFFQMFSSLNTDLDKLCLTQSQIVSYCQKNRWHLRQYFATFFLVKENDEFFVAIVNLKNDGLGRPTIYHYPFKSDNVWKAEHYYCLVSPI